MDILTLGKETYINLALSLPDHVFSFLIRANLLLACPIIAAYIGFSQGQRNQKVQITLMAIGALISLSIPIDFMLEEPSWRPILLVVLVLGGSYLPVFAGYLVHPHLGMQAKVQKYTRIGLAVLFILNLFMGR
jgi:hypothetical protein